MCSMREKDDKNVLRIFKVCKHFDIDDVARDALNNANQ